MLARLILLLIMICAAPMAMAQPVCHDAAPRMTGMTHHGAPAEKAVPAADLCLGCIAPATLHPPVLAKRIAAAAPAPAAPVPTGIAGASIPPATPPPRQG